MLQEIDKKTTIIELVEPLIRKDEPFLHLCTKESSKDDFEFWHIVVDELLRDNSSKKLLINFGTKDNIFHKVLCFRFRLPYSLQDPISRNNMNDNQEYFAYHYSHGFTFPLININFYKENLINIEKVINFFITEGVDVVFLRNVKLGIETEKYLFALQEKLMDRGVKLITHIRYNDYMFSDTTKLKNLIFIEKKSEYENICQIRNLCGQTSPRYYQCFQDCTLEIEKKIKIWLDDIRPAPDGFTLAHSVNEAIALIKKAEKDGVCIEVIDCDHDLGDYFPDGGDGIKLLDWLCERQTFYPIALHTANPVGRDNMLRLIKRHWR